MRKDGDSVPCTLNVHLFYGVVLQGLSQAFLLSFLYQPSLFNLTKLFIYPIQEETVQSISPTLIGYCLQTITLKKKKRITIVIFFFLQSKKFDVGNFIRNSCDNKKRQSTGLKKFEKRLLSSSKCFFFMFQKEEVKDEVTVKDLWLNLLINFKIYFDIQVCVFSVYGLGLGLMVGHNMKHCAV